MKKLIATLALIWPLVGLADYQSGHEALQRGDYATALRELRPLAEQGNPEAQNDLGGMLSEGLGVPVDEREAVKWIRLAAEQGYAEAQYRLGILYGKGVGVPVDNSEAAKWIRLAAEQGHGNAQNKLGRMYTNELGVPADYREAVKWIRRSAEQGVADAQNNLGVMYGTGLGVPMDMREAARWIRLAAEQDHAEAQYNLGLIYADGLGVARDDVQAYVWFSRVADQGHAAALEQRELVRSRMTPAQLERARGLSGKPAARSAETRTAAPVDATRRYITHDQVRYRTGPGVEYPRLGVLRAGVVLQVEATQGAWLRVRLRDGRTAYVHGDYAQPVE